MLRLKQPSILFLIVFFLVGTSVALAQSPVIDATKGDSDPPLVDIDGNNVADSGDTIRYKIEIQNTGSGTGTGTTFADTIDSNTTLIPGSLNTSPLAYPDTYSTLGNVGITVSAVTGLLANDVDLDGDNGGVPQLVSCDAVSANDGTVSCNADGVHFKLLGKDVK